MSSSSRQLRRSRPRSDPALIVPVSDINDNDEIEDEPEVQSESEVEQQNEEEKELDEERSVLSSSSRNSNHALISINGMNGLFGNPSIPPTLANVPKLESTDAASFADWRIKFKGYCLMQGIKEVVFNPYEEALELAITMDQTSRPRTLIVQLLRALHAKAYGAIMTAVEKVTGSAIFNEIEAEQSSKSDIFIDTNANFLWVRLCARYEKKTVHSTLHVWKKLLSLSYKDGENPQLLRKTFDSLLIQLTQINDVILPGQIISEGFKACIWLNALPLTLESTTQTLLTQPKGNI